MLNAGHQRNRPAKRYDATNQRVESIPTFAMAALAGIGAMPDTIEDRAVIVRMRRRAPGESVAPYRHRRDRPALRVLADDLRAWLRAAPVRFGSAPNRRCRVEDRAADTWEPLVAVADYAGGGWGDRARAAVLALTADRRGRRADSDRKRLLVDSRAAFGDETALPTAELLHRAATRGRGAVGASTAPTGLTAMRLGTLLKEYGIRSRHHALSRCRAGQGLPPRGLRRLVGALLLGPVQPTGRPSRRGRRGSDSAPPGAVGLTPATRGSRTSRTSLIFAGQPRYGFPAWYGSSRTTATALVRLKPYHKTKPYRT